MTRTVDGNDVAEAFDDALRPRMARVVTETTRAGELAALERFRESFDLGGHPKPATDGHLKTGHHT